MWVVVKIMVPIRVILGLHWGSMGDNGKENGNYYSIIGIILWWLSKLWVPFWVPYIRPRIIIGTQKGTIILKVPHV